MAYATTKSTVVYVTEESVAEGTAVDPTLGTQAVGILADGYELNLEKETVERNLLRSGIQTQIPRTGIKTSTGTIGVEMASSSTAGTEPDYDLLMQSLLGGRRQAAAAVTSGTGHTTAQINIEDADIGDFAVGDIVLVKEAGAYHASPISAVDSSAGSANITLLVAGDSAFSDNVVIEAFTTYYGTNSGHKSLTITSYLEDAYEKQAFGVKVGSLSLDGFETGGSASFNFGLAGLGMTHDTAASGLTASYGNAKPPIILEACLYVDGTILPVNSVSLSVENTVGRVTSTCSPNGILSQRMTQRAITGSITPYLDTANTNLFDKFDLTTEFSLFFRAWNPTGTTGEKQNAVSVFVPNCVITALPDSDADGIRQFGLDFSAGEDESGTYASDIYFSYS